VGALIALAGQVLRRGLGAALGGPGRRALAGGAAGGLAIEELTGGGLPGFFGFGGGGGGGGAGGGRRRRRRKALTDSDIRIALTISNAISKKAAENFILQRVRSS